MNHTSKVEKKVLFIGELPPLTLNGVAKMNEQYLKVLYREMKVSVINDITHKRVLKRHLLLFLNLFSELLKGKVDFLYMNLPASRQGLIKTFIILLICNLTCKKYIFHIHRGDIQAYENIIFKLIVKLFFKKITIILLCKEYEKDLKNRLV